MTPVFRGEKTPFVSLLPAINTLSSLAVTSTFPSALTPRGLRLPMTNSYTAPSVATVLPMESRAVTVCLPCASVLKNRVLPFLSFMVTSAASALASFFRLAMAFSEPPVRSLARMAVVLLLFMPMPWAFRVTFFPCTLAILPWVSVVTPLSLLTMALRMEYSSWSFVQAKVGWVYLSTIAW